MAQTCHLWLKANGTDINGDSTVISLGRENTIECLKFEYKLETTRDGASGMTTGERVHRPITITKRCDKSSPLLYKALCNNEVVEGIIKFYRPNPTGDGTTEQYFTIEFKEARVSSIRSFQPFVMDPNTANLPELEEVSFAFGEISWTYVPNGIMHVDHWSQRTLGKLAI